MSKELNEQEIHNIGMNHVGKHLKSLGYEFLGVNSALKKHPQFVIYKKGEGTIFVLVSTKTKPENPWKKNESLLKKLENHAKDKKAKLWFAGVELSSEDESLLKKDSEIIIRFNGIEVIFDAETLEI